MEDFFQCNKSNYNLRGRQFKMTTNTSRTNTRSSYSSVNVAISWIFGTVLQEQWTISRIAWTIVHCGAYKSITLPSPTSSVSSKYHSLFKEDMLDNFLPSGIARILLQEGQEHVAHGFRSSWLQSQKDKHDHSVWTAAKFACIRKLQGARGPVPMPGERRHCFSQSVNMIFKASIKSPLFLLLSSVVNPSNSVIMGEGSQASLPTSLIN